MMVRGEIARAWVPHQADLVGDKNVWLIAYSWQRRRSSLFRTIRYWTYPIGCLLVTSHEEHRSEAAMAVESLMNNTGQKDIT